MSRYKRKRKTSVDPPGDTPELDSEVTPEQDPEPDSESPPELDSKPDSESTPEPGYAVPPAQNLKPDDPYAGLPRVSLAVYLRLSGLKIDQLAGFRRYAESENLGPLPIPVWKERHKQFRDRPVGNVS